MEERPAPRWCVALIRAMQDSHDVTMLLMLVVAGALFAMMAIGMLAAHVAGRL